MTRVLRVLAAVVLAAALAACADDGDDSPFSEACEASMQVAADERDVSKANPLITDTLSKCSTAEEWLAGVRAYPAVMGMTEQAVIGKLDLQVACHGHDSTPVCEDAYAEGLLP